MLDECMFTMFLIFTWMADWAAWFQVRIPQPEVVQVALTGCLPRLDIDVVYSVLIYPLPSSHKMYCHSLGDSITSIPPAGLLVLDLQLLHHNRSAVCRPVVSLCHALYCAPHVIGGSSPSTADFIGFLYCRGSLAYQPHLGWWSICIL